jgi:hypothetical protein
MVKSLRGLSIFKIAESAVGSTLKARIETMDRVVYLDAKR